MADELELAPGRRLFGQLLHDVDRLLQRRLDQYTRRLGMTRAQWRAMQALDVGQGCNQRELATVLACEPITLGRLIDRLCEADLVERYPDASDRRAWRLRLTASGAEAVSRMRRCALDYEIESADGLSSTDIANIRRVLLVAKANLADALCRSDRTGTAETAAPARQLPAR